MKTLGYVLLLILGVVLIAAPGSCAFAILVGGGSDTLSILPIVAVLSGPPIIAGIFILRRLWRRGESGQGKG
jgi:hypothetical protein